jgi:DNA-directed RNA polymerase subunit M/transcription elongation factor TFIIS
MTSRHHIKVNKDLLNGNDNLKRYFKIVEEDDRKISCSICGNKSFYYENLQTHLELHINQLTEAVDYLQSRKNPSKQRTTSPSVATHKKKVNVPTTRSEKKGDKEASIGDVPLEEQEELKAEQEEVKKPKLIAEDAALTFRIMVTHFILENNLPFSISERICELFRQLTFALKDTGVMKYATLPDKVIRSIATDCICPCMRKYYLDILKDTYYSISLDAGTAINKTEYLGINARFISKDKLKGRFQTVTKTLGLIPLGPTSTGKDILNLVENFLFSDEDGIKRRQKLIGIACDHASNLISTGEKSMTSMLLQGEDMKHLVVVHDICHALNLVLKHCIKQFPENFTKLIEDISSTFRHSPQKSLRLKQIIGDLQDKDIKVAAIKRHVPTRWSSLQQSFQRILQLCAPLALFLIKRA